MKTHPTKFEDLTRQQLLMVLRKWVILRPGEEPTLCGYAWREQQQNLIQEAWAEVERLMARQAEAGARLSQDGRGSASDISAYYALSEAKERAVERWNRLYGELERGYQ